MTKLMVTTDQINRNEEVKRLLKEFNMPIIRIEQNLELLRDGLEGMNVPFI